MTPEYPPGSPADRAERLVANWEYALVNRKLANGQRVLVFTNDVRLRMREDIQHELEDTITREHQGHDET